MDVLGRHRNLIILVGVLFVQLLGLAMQVKRAGPDAENTRLIRIWAVDLVTPFERALVWFENDSGNVWRNYIYLRGVRAENRELKEQIEQMRLEQVRLEEDAAQAHRLQTLLAFKEQYIAKTVAAQVIGSSGSDLSRVIYIDKGDDAGVKRDMAVITSDGVVGKVLQVFPSVSQVLLINDQSSGVGTILEKSRLQGFLKGKADGEITLEGVMSDEQVTPGERVLTSGGDQIFPKGLPVGTVTQVGNGKDLFPNINIKSSADLSKLEEVLVLVDKQERQAIADDTTHVRAADILAQRLPSVPVKPPDDKTGAAGGTTTGSATKTAPKTSGGNSLSATPSAPTSGSATPARSPAKNPGLSSGAGKPANAGTGRGDSAPSATQAAKPADSPSDSGNTPATPPPAVTPSNSQPAADDPH